MLELIAGVLLAVGLLALVIQPLWTGAGKPTPGPSGDVDEADLVDLDESDSPKIQALLALREIDFDRATGKLSDGDYEQLKARYTAKALAAMREEEASEAIPSPDRDDQAERMIARSKPGRRAVCPSCGPRPEPNVVFCSSCGRSLATASASPRCWVCGADLPAGARFCGGCGAAVAAA